LLQNIIVKEEGRAVDYCVRSVSIISKIYSVFKICRLSATDSLGRLT